MYLTLSVWRSVLKINQQLIDRFWLIFDEHCAETVTDFKYGPQKNPEIVFAKVCTLWVILGTIIIIGKLSSLK